MDKSKKAPSKKTKAVEDLNTPFFADLLKFCEENEFSTLLAYFVLNSEVTPGFPWTTYPPPVKTSPEEERIIIYIAFDNFEKQGIVNKLYIKNQTVPIALLEALFLTFPKYDTFTAIKLEYCNLTPSEIEFLQTILTEFQNIVDLSLDGNPNSRQNFAAILQDTNIKNLSLKRCKINEHGMKKLCKTLWNSNKLLTLNLTGNYIDDSAVIHLAKMLRQNRKLRTINLADNWITDAGCYAIMSSLQSFILTQEEIIIKRKINFEYFKQIANLIEEYKKEQDQATESKLHLGPGRTSEKTNGLKTKREIQVESLARINSKKSLRKGKWASKENITGTPLYEDKQLYFFIECNVTKRTHPFAIDIIEREGEIQCFGNMKFAYINLAYNKISSTGYKHIIDTLYYQLYNDYLGPGLTYITIDGNADVTSPEFYEIYKILLEKKLKMDTFSASKTTILNKRSASKYSSIVNFT